MRPLSPAQRHRARILQEQAQAASPYGVELAGDAYDLMRVKLSQDKSRLSTIQSHERRAEFKAKLLPEYLDWIETALDKGTGAQDQVLTTVMVWCFDAGAYELGLRIARYVIAHRMPMADDYRRSPAALVIDELANAYLRGQWAPLAVQRVDGGTLRLATPDHVADPAALRLDAAATLGTADSITEEQDAPDQARAKLCKAIAYASLGKVQTAEEPDLSALPVPMLVVAKQRLQRAFELDSNSGVKKDLERVERALSKSDKSVPLSDAATAAPAPAFATGEATAAPRRSAAKKATARKATARR
jgi:hypothetical protein